FAVAPSAHTLPAPHPTHHKRTRRPGLDIVAMGPPECCEYHLSARTLPGEELRTLVNRVADAMHEFDIQPVMQFTFASLAQLERSQKIFQEVFGPARWPETRVEGKGCGGEMAGIQMVGLSPRPVQPIFQDKRVVGCYFDDEFSEVCLLGGLEPTQIGIGHADETQQALANMEAALGQGGFSMSDIVRTWFYLDDLLSWYKTFNKVRTKFYSRHTFVSRAFPASTGVEGRNPSGAALTAAVWAVQPFDNLRIQEVQSPLQCPASDYRSSFSRAMELDTPEGRRLTISGTASIAPGGETICKDDVRAQIATTMEVVEAILNSRGMNFEHITRAIAYFKSAADSAHFADWCKTKGRHLPPVVQVACDICRDDLLFEIELDAFA
ncbi:MAG: Rid family hydrolase, partial [Limisphaerales bacterium]